MPGDPRSASCFARMADPTADVKNFAKVKYTVRGGKVIYGEK
jgi:hypothetical protein